jgi:polyhydroxybutyrate depolymerase
MIRWKIKAIIMTLTVISAMFFPPRVHAETIEHASNIFGLKRMFRVYIPPLLSGKSGLPLVIALHGGGSNGKAMEKFSRLSETARKDGFIAVYPDGTGRIKRMLTWNAGSCCGYAAEKNVDDVAFIRFLIGFMIREYRVDSSRIFLTGMSNGAMMAYRLAAEIPERIAAIAPVSGTCAGNPEVELPPMPVMHFHGTEDAYAPWAGGRGSRSLQRIDHAPVEGILIRWINANKAKPVPATRILPDRFNDGTRVIRCAYAAPDDSERVVLYKIVGGGHTWPGQTGLHPLMGRTTHEISANDVMWKFFLAHPQKPHTEKH